MNIAGRRLLRLTSHVWPHVWLGVACLTLGGCFTGEYERRMEETLNELQTESKKVSALFDAASEVVDASETSTGISLGLSVFRDEKAEPVTAGQSCAPSPFFALPSFPYAREIPFDGEPAYVCEAAVEVARWSRMRCSAGTDRRERDGDRGVLAEPDARNML